MPPDEHHQEVNNSIYTNVVASLSIQFGRYAACLAGEDEEDLVPDRWLRVAHDLEFPYNRDRRYHEEFEDFEKLYLESDLTLSIHPSMRNTSSLHPSIHPSI